MKYAHPDDLEESNRLLEEVWAGNSDFYRFESRMKHKDGHWVWVYDTGQVIEWESKGVPKRMIGTHLDISDKKTTIDELDVANRQLRELSYADPLTKIPNKRAYNEEIKRELVAAKRSKTPLSLLLIGLDNFKGYNDKHGHERGDDLLHRVAQLIRDVLLRKTDFVARIGGDEFAVILPFTDLAGAYIKALKIQQAVDSEKDQGGFAILKDDVSLSIGISSSEISLESLFENADTALYSAKNRGRNRIEVYTKDQIHSLEGQVRQHASLSKALCIKSLLVQRYIAIKNMAYPSFYNLIVDPKEEEPEKFYLDDTWVETPLYEVMEEHLISISQDKGAPPN